MANEDGVWRTIGGRRVFIKKGQSLESAMKESGKFNKATKTKKEIEAEFEKNVDEMYNRFHGKTDKEIAEEIAKERGERLLTDEEQKQREIDFMKNLEKEVDQKKKLGRWEIDENGKKVYNERELGDDERGYWTKENGRRVFKENPNYKEPSSKSYKASDLEEGKPYEIDMGNGIKKTAIYMGKDEDGNSSFYDGEGVSGTFGFSDKFINDRLKITDNKDDDKFIELHNQIRGSKAGTSDYNDELKAQARRRIWAEKTLYEQYNNSDRKGKQELTNNFNKELRKQNELEKKYGKISEEDFKKMQSDIYKEAEDYKTKQKESGTKITSDSYNKQMDSEYKKLKDGKISTEEYLKNTDKISDEYYKERNKLYDDYKKIDKNAKNEGTIDELREKYEKASGSKDEPVGEVTREEKRAETIKADVGKHKVPKSIENQLLSDSVNNRARGITELTEYVADQEEWIDITAHYYGGNAFQIEDRDGNPIDIGMGDYTYEKINKKIADHYEKKNNNQDWVKKAFAQYKKEHKNTKLTLDDFRKQQK